MARMNLLNECGINVEGFCLVKSAQVKTDSKGGTYVDMVVSDRGGECVAKLWNYNPGSHGTFATDDVIKIRGTVNVWKDTEQIKIEKIRIATDADEVDMTKLVPCAPIDVKEIYDTLYEAAGAFSDKDLGRLVQYLMHVNKERLLVYPAAVKLHHATRSGLLHHTYSVYSLAMKVCSLYPQLDSELVAAGAILHDLGKVDEMDTSELGLASQYTAEGQLCGHIQLGIDRLHAAADTLGTPAETVLLLEHMLLSHHGQPEFGSPRFPMFPEAEVLSECDLMDSRLYEMFAALDGVSKGGFSERIWALDNRQLYKHGRK